MNAIDMAIQAAIGKLTDKAPELLAKALESLPPDIVSNIGQIGQITLKVIKQLDRIEAQQRLIMDHLGIDHGEKGNGNGARQLEN